MPQPETQQGVTQEQPLYVLPQNKKRTIIPKLITFLVLGVIFYFGILLNISLLQLTDSTESLIKLISLIVLVAVILLGIILNFRKAGKKYHFYGNRITFGKKQILLNEITEPKKEQKTLDKLFKTYSLVLSPKFSIKNIPQSIQIQDYLQKLINYSRGQQY